MEEGVRRLFVESLCDLEEGLPWIVPLSRNADEAWFVLPLDAVPDLLCPPRSMFRVATPLIAWLGDGGGDTSGTELAEERDARDVSEFIAPF